MPANIVDDFNAYRARMNEKLLEDNNKIIKRIFNLDTNAYMEGSTSQEDQGTLGTGEFACSAL